jgi:adenosylcobinamide kinase/adenosylcobinamide-phosphate guanylyltransferase
MAPLLSDGQDVGTVIIDSVDVWVANLLMQYVSDPKETIEKIVTDAVDQLLVLMAVSPQAYVMVSSEVGLSLVPPEPLGRRFQDLLGLVNQRLAATATEVYLVVAGIPMQIKPYD